MSVKPAGASPSTPSIPHVDPPKADLKPTEPPKAAGPSRPTDTFQPSSQKSTARPNTAINQVDLARTSGAGAIDTSVAQASKSWVSQWGPTASNSSGHPAGFEDCGPTSALVLANAMGLVPKPSPGNAEAAIGHMRDLALGFHSDQSRPTSDGQIANALQKVGARTQTIGHDAASIDKALSEGKRVLISGDPWTAWGKSMDQKGEYLNHRDPGGHFVAVMGKTPDGKYLVNDPLSKVGAIAVSRDQLNAFFRLGGGNDGAVAVWNPKGSTGTPAPVPTPGGTGGTGTPGGLTAPTADLAAGAHGPQVEQLQHCLVKLGYLSQSDMNTGPGAYGQHTQAALAHFQTDHGIPGNHGQNYGPQTRAALEAALSKAGGSGSTGGVTGPTGAGLSPLDKETAKRIDAAIAQGWPNSKLQGYGQTIVEACRKEKIPVDFMMAQMQKESSFLGPKDNLSRANNNPGNLRWAKWEAEFGGKPGGPGGFTQFPNIESGIRAQAHLLRHVYGDQVDKRDWNSLIHKYCPPSDNKNILPNDPTGEKFVAQYVQQMTDSTNAWQKKLGVDSNWVNEHSGSGAQATGTAASSPRTAATSAPSGAGPTAPTSDLAVGAQGPAVEQLQSSLVKLGYLSQSDMNTGPGTYGQHTQAALAHFQTDHGITGNNGENYGPRTRAALQEALSRAGGITPPSTGNGSAVNMPQYGQMNPQWANQPYAFNSNLTLGDVGCTLTALSMAASYSTGNGKFTPGYVNSGHYGEALAAVKTTHLGDQLGHPLRHLDERGPGFTNIGRGTGQANALLDSVKSSLARGQPVVLGLDLSGAGGGGIEHGWTRHTVVAVGVQPNGDILLNDPATGGQSLLSSYMNRPQFTGFDMADAVVK